jgi:hypothetical protein
MSDPKEMTPEGKNAAIRDRYVDLMAPVFHPDDPTKPDIIQLFASLLRVVGMEDKGWDPYAESRALLDDLYALMQHDLPQEKFKDNRLTMWRLGLLFYSHIVEMSAPYEVLTNLLRFRLGKGYSPNPYYEFLTTEERKRFKRTGIYPRQKIKIIQALSEEAGLKDGTIFDEFFRADFRNAIAHPDFIFTEKGFRCRNDGSTGAFELSFEEVDDILTKAKVFIGTFFGLERDVRRAWGAHAGKGMAYDPALKGVMEVLVDADGLLNGFKLHWPNGTDSVYRRTEQGVEMTNCMLALDHATLTLFVGSYAQRPSRFSALVEEGEPPKYTALENGVTPAWNP